MSKTPQKVPDQDLAGIAWRISSYSASNGGDNCVEAGAFTDGSGRVAVRHSHHPDGQIIVYTKQEWDAFTHGVRNSEFDF